jgi:alkylation response protein AidB-like acyl-CoA dehydrogenase
VDLLLDDQERLIKDTAREFFATESTPERVRSAEEDSQKYSPDLWKKIGEQGWLGVSLPESCGGQALPLTYAGLLMEEAGRHIAPIPMHSTMVTALALARHDGDRFKDLLSKVASAEIADQGS